MSEANAVRLCDIPKGVISYMRLRGLPSSEGSIFSHLLLSHFADSRRMRIGYKVPEASPVCLAMSAPDSPVKGLSRNRPSTWRVGPERRGESLPIYETLHRVKEPVKPDCELKLSKMRRFQAGKPVFLYAMAGCLLPKPVACSNACASCRTPKSCLSRPTICTPTGRPSGVKPPGTEAAGFPVAEMYQQDFIQSM